jgi:hemoglobin
MSKSTKQAAAVETAAPETLYARLGGHDAIFNIARDIYDNHANNPTIKARFVDSDAQQVAAIVGELMCAGFGGPETYTGKDMVTAHRGMNISEAEFIAVCDDVMDALDKHSVGQREKDEILGILYSMKADVVHG